MGVQQDDVVPSNLIADSPCETAPPSNPWFIGSQRWSEAENAAQGIISKFQPTNAAERKRDAVINYLQKLLKANLDCEVFAYGSVPLKTYLPDGDIDLSAVGINTHDLIKKIASLLKSEVKSNSSDFVVNDVQLIGAEVKLVKCMVENLVVDISVNQIGGLCTLCFLEQVDRLIKKDHLFKRSIILIKAWCFYESRTLGAHAGLISTYGLETLVLYIFHVFHITLDGPLSVLYKFLEYFSTFDWDNYGISLMGPIRLSELPRIIAERPPNYDDLLLKLGFLRRCTETLSIPIRPGDVFFRKHLNIVDPLNCHNNLGRSVSQGNFFRIRSAFGYGAKKLAQILMAPEDNLNNKLFAFFSNTVRQHGSGQRPDVPDHIPRSSLTIGISRVETTLISEVCAKPRSSNDENLYLGNSLPLGNQISAVQKDVSALKLSREEEVPDPISIPFSAPHLLFNYSKLVNSDNNDANQSKVHDEEVHNNDAKQSKVHDEEVPCEAEEESPSKPLDLAGDLFSHMVCLDHVRWWNNFPFSPPAMMGRPPPPPPPPILLSMIASEHGGMNSVGGHPHFHTFVSRPPFHPNDHNPRVPTNYFLDLNQFRHGDHTSTTNTTNNATPNLNNIIPAPQGVMQQGESLLHRRRHQNHNRSRQQERPRSVSGSRYNRHTI